MKRTLVALAALMVMVPTTASAYEWVLKSVYVTSYQTSGTAAYEVEVEEVRGKLVGLVKYQNKIVARNLPVKIDKCRDGRTRPTGQFKRSRRGGKTLQLILRADYPEPGSKGRRNCEIVLDDLPLSADHTTSESPPGTRPGTPPD